MRRLLAEFVGTFFLMLTICLAVAGGLGALAPIAIGLSLTVMVYACGHLSGSHFNPAVSLAVFLRGKMNIGEAVTYALVQVIAAVAAAGAAIAMEGSALTAKAISPGSAIAAETLGGFALVWVILNVATAKATAGNQYYGFAIGMTVAAMAAALGQFSGGAFNPAVAVGGAVFGLFRWADIWVHILGTVMGAAAAAFAFRATHPDDL